MTTTIKTLEAKINSLNKSIKAKKWQITELEDIIIGGGSKTDRSEGSPRHRLNIIKREVIKDYAECIELEADLAKLNSEEAERKSKKKRWFR